MVIVAGNYKHASPLSSLSLSSLFNIKICSANGKIGNVTARPGGRNEQKPSPLSIRADRLSQYSWAETDSEKQEEEKASSSL